MKRLWAWLRRRGRAGAQERAAREAAEAARAEAELAVQRLADAKSKDREVSAAARQLRQLADPDVLARWVEQALRGNR